MEDINPNGTDFSAKVSFSSVVKTVKRFDSHLYEHIIGSFRHDKFLNTYILYELNNLLNIPGNGLTIKSCLFDAAKLIRNAIKRNLFKKFYWIIFYRSG